jgi:hypothetical protein
MSASKQPNPPAGQSQGGPPAQPPEKVRLRVKGKWKDVDVKEKIKKAGLDWVMYVDDDGLETWQVS